MIYDEAHRCKNRSTNNANVLLSIHYTPGSKILLVSATIADTINNFIIFGYVLGLYQDMKKGRKWIKDKGKDYDNMMMGVHKAIYPEYASRMKISTLEELFPVNNIVAKCYNMDESPEIQQQYNIIEHITSLSASEKKDAHYLAKLMKARQKIELLKAPTLIDLIKQYIAENKSIVVFVNFTGTLDVIADNLNTECTVHGGQTLEERDTNIAEFKNNTSRIIICNMRSGGTGISLHDTDGSFPRIALISPSWSAQDLVQALGRIYRAKTKSEVNQVLVYCKGSIEEDICKNISAKLQNISSINDGDTDSYTIKDMPEAVKKKPKTMRTQNIGPRAPRVVGQSNNQSARYSNSSTQSKKKKKDCVIL